MPQTREEINAKKREKYKNLCKEDKEALKARMRMNTAKWSSKKKSDNGNTTVLQQEIRDLKLENQRLKLSIEHRKEGETNMLNEINGFPSYFLHCCHDHFGDCCRNPDYQDNFGNTRQVLITR
jgi:hypothetical protein